MKPGRQSRAAAAAAAFVALVASVVCGDPVPAPQVKPNDHYACVEGDTDVPPQEEILEPFGDTGAIEGTGAVDETGGMAWDEGEPTYAAPSARGAKPSDSRAAGLRSTVMCKPTPSSGRDDIWDQARVDALTYCFSEFADQELEAAIRSAVADSTWEYELVADINFVHVSELDGDNCDQDADVVFVVRQGMAPGDCGPAGCPVGQAFFPSHADLGNTKTIFFFPTALENESFTTHGLVQHECGHALGLYHEQARYFQQDGVLDAIQEFKCVLASWTHESMERYHTAGSEFNHGLPLLPRHFRGKRELVIFRQARASVSLQFARTH